MEKACKIVYIFIAVLLHSLYKLARIVPLPFLAIFEIIFYIIYFSLQVTQYNTLMFVSFYERIVLIELAALHPIVLSKSGMENNAFSWLL